MIVLVLSAESCPLMVVIVVISAESMNMNLSINSSIGMSMSMNTDTDTATDTDMNNFNGHFIKTRNADSFIILKLRIKCSSIRNYYGNAS